MSVDAKRVQAIFLAAVEIADAAQRAAILDRECGADAELRQRMEALLLGHQAPDSILDRPPPLEAVAPTPVGTEALAPTSDQEAASMATPEQGSGTTGDGPKILDEARTDPSVTQADLLADGKHDLRFLTPSAKPGHLGLLGHYEVLGVIGKGGFGIVLKGFDERLHRVVAIKVLSPAFAANGSARKRFIREARAAAAVKNEHVVGIYDVQENAEPPYLVMECIDGISLQDKIDKHGSLGVKEILRIGMQIAEGLADAHKQGLVHRDIKPANILLENAVERVKITDFGLARAVDDASVTQSGTVAGTPMYMSPEQAEGLPIDHRSDLFSLGTVLYAMCTGQPPFRASGTHAVLKRVIDASPRPIREINNEIPGWLCDIIGKLHAKTPEERFQTAKEVAELLGQHLAQAQQPGAAPIISQAEGRISQPPALSLRSISRIAPWSLGLGLIFALLAGIGMRTPVAAYESVFSPELALLGLLAGGLAGAIIGPLCRSQGFPRVAAIALIALVGAFTGAWMAGRFTMVVRVEASWFPDGSPARLGEWADGVEPAVTVAGVLGGLLVAVLGAWGYGCFSGPEKPSAGQMSFQSSPFHAALRIASLSLALALLLALLCGQGRDYSYGGGGTIDGIGHATFQSRFDPNTALVGLLVGAVAGPTIGLLWRHQGLVRLGALGLIAFVGGFGGMFLAFHLDVRHPPIAIAGVGGLLIAVLGACGYGWIFGTTAPSRA
jgi:serine/threonine protein kinase